MILTMLQDRVGLNNTIRQKLGVRILTMLQNCARLNPTILQ